MLLTLAMCAYAHTQIFKSDPANIHSSVSVSATGILMRQLSLALGAQVHFFPVVARFFSCSPGA